MVRKFVFAFTVVALAVSVAVAGEPMFGRITKVEGDKVTFEAAKGKFEKGKKPEYEKAKTLTVAKDAKIQQMKGFGPDAESVDLKDGLKDKLFTDIPEFGRGARITTNAKGEITQIQVFGGFKGKKKKDNE
jgi:hypothetical protein